MKTTFEAREEASLSPLAIKSSQSKGRKFPENPSSTRTCFQRDRDRIIHSKAFRRLKHKTQVFISTNDDHFRTRLTHTLEVTQLTRHLARLLNLNEDLAECIALAHDLGHTPFGHSGEHILNSLMENEGGFEHNFQSLRIVDFLEKKHPLYEGLNLSKEVRHGLLKHKKNIRTLTEPYIASLEAQAANLADEFAYCAHDIDDGISAGILTTDELIQHSAIYKESYFNIKEKFHAISDDELRPLIHSELLSHFITDATDTSEHTIKTSGLTSLREFQENPILIITVTPELSEKIKELKAFLFNNLYRHHSIVAMNRKGAEIIENLFQYYMTHFQDLEQKVIKIPSEYPSSQKRMIADYIAGMTDTFAINEHQTLYS